MFGRHHDGSAQANAVGAIDSTGQYQNVFSSGTKESRTVVDFEIGKDLGIGGEPDSLRVVGSVRYARFDTNTKFAGTYFFTGTPYYSFNAAVRSKFEGAGPRLGLGTRLPLGASFNLLLAGSGSALYGEHRTAIKAVYNVPNPVVIGPVPFSTITSENGWALNLEAEAALSYKLLGSELQFGTRADGWIDPSKGASAGGNCNFAPPDNNGCTRLGNSDRHAVTPFARVKIKIGD